MTRPSELARVTDGRPLVDLSEAWGLEAVGKAGDCQAD